MIFVLSISTSLSWGEVLIRDKIIEILPNELKFLLSSPLAQEIHKKLGNKIVKYDGDKTLFLNYFDNKNDVSIGLKKGKVSYLYVELPSSISSLSQNLYHQVLHQLTPEQKTKIIQDNQKTLSRKSGRFIDISLVEEGLTLEFTNNEQKLLHSVIIYTKEKE